jgi:acetyl esterase
VKNDLTIDSKVISMYEKLREADLVKDVATLSPAQEREQEQSANLLFIGKLEKVAKIENRKIPQLNDGGEIPIRIYYPMSEPGIALDDKGNLSKLPIVVFIHGGGFVAGDLHAVEETCCAIANRADSIVISVDYRLAPEFKFPSGLEDCFAASIWARVNASTLGGDPTNVIVAGDSAGGNLTAATCLMARDTSNLPPIALQALIYPVTDLSRNMGKYSGARFGPSAEEMDWIIKHYLQTKTDVMNPLVSPLLADLSGLPPAVIITAENDPLREQDLDYARKLEKFGVSVSVLDYPGMVHGFFTLPSYFDSGKLATDKLASIIRSLKD